MPLLRFVIVDVEDVSVVIKFTGLKKVQRNFGGADLRCGISFRDDEGEL